MGVLNVTPDSFSDGGRYMDPGRAVERGLEMAAEGADIVDVGGESTRPGAAPVSEEAEVRRVLPVIESLASRTEVPISVDTRKAAVARRCLLAGAAVLNDVGGLRDPAMAETAAELGASVVVMHMRGTPATMQRDTAYSDVVGEIRDYLEARADLARRSGIDEIAVDPGLGFGKSPQQNFEILAGLRTIVGIGLPVLIGPSRKSFLGSLPGALPPGERLEGTLAAVAAGVMRGAKVVRVHDVGPCRRVLDVLDAVKGAGSDG